MTDTRADNMFAGANGRGFPPERKVSAVIFEDKRERTAITKNPSEMKTQTPREHFIEQARTQSPAYMAGFLYEALTAIAALEQRLDTLEKK